MKKMRAGSVGSGLKALYVFVVMSVSVAAFSSCGSVPKVETTLKATEGKSDAQPGMQALDEGMLAFREQEYGKAAQVFESLIEKAETEHLRNTALYALACTRLFLARTADEWEGAVSLWNQWSHQRSDVAGCQDPRMLSPLIEGSGNPDTSGRNFLKSLNPDEEVVYRNRSSSKDLATCKGHLQARDKELERVKSRLALKEREVRHLKSQIDSLEAIHLKIQEKKKEISTP
jgi:hypothetical protein